MKKRREQPPPSKEVHEVINYINEGHEVLLPTPIKTAPQIVIPKIYSLFRATRKAGGYWYPECHTAWEMVYVIGGVVNEVADNQTYTLREGDIIFHKPMEYHQLCPDDTEDSDILIISFDLEGELAHRLKNKVLHIDAHSRVLVDNIIRYIASLHLTYTPCLTLDLREYAADNERVLLPLIKLFEAFFLSLALVKQENFVQNTRENDALNIRVIQMLEKHLYDWVNVADIAAACGVSTKTLQTRFRESTGYTIHKYFMNIKMRTAIDLLMSGKNVSEVSDALGFCNSNYFSQVFYRETGKHASSYK